MYPKTSFADAARWAQEKTALMTLEEKCRYVGGTDIFFTQAIERLGISRVMMSDATAGVVLRDRFYDVTYQNPLHKSTAFPAPIMLAATWNPSLAEQYASSIAEQCNANGIGVLLGPGLNMYRISQCGRNFEYFGEDPFLIARMVERYVRGVQNQGVVATLKHFVANNTDYFRRKSNSVIDQRTLHEIYLPGFKAGIDAGAMAVMTAYNLVNGEWTGQSKAVITDLLRTQLGFKGLVMTDWWSVYDGVATAKSGQDLEMPASQATARLAQMVNEGEVTEAEVDRMVTSILTTFKAMELFGKKPQPELQTNFPKHEAVALDTAREGIVLLRNQNNILPLDDSDDDILLLGEYIHTKATGGGSSFVKGYNQITAFEALRQTFGERVHYLAAPTDDDIRNAKRIILSVGTTEAESWDRPFALPIGEELYVRRVLKLNPNVIVLINAGSGLRMTDWHDQAAAILYCWYNGQNGNIALAEILSGEVNPSGKLPFTIEREFKDGPGAGYIPEGEILYNGANDEWEAHRGIYDVNYGEGVFVGYRWYEQRQIAPLFPFGYGLSYSRFEYSDLRCDLSEKTADQPLIIQFKLRNAGPLAGMEVAQVYLHDCEASVPRPIKELKGFRKLALAAGEEQTVEITLSAEAFAFYDEQQQGWTVEPGRFEVLVGPSSADMVLKAEVTVR